MTFWERYFGGHINLGHLTIYGENAMHWGCTYWTQRWGYICFRLPLHCYGRWWSLYFYVSPNATPWAATFYLGEEKINRFRAKLRKKSFGHNYDVDYNYNVLQYINYQMSEEQIVNG